MTGDKFMPELHLRQLGFTYSACGPFTKHHERIQKFKETGDLNYIWKRIKSCFVDDAVDANSKDLAKKVLVQIRFWKIGPMKLH